MFNKDVIDHIILYIKENPSSIAFDSYRDINSVIITGSTPRGNYGDREFRLSLAFDTQGVVTNINGEIIAPNVALQSAIEDAIVLNFKTKRKLTSLTSGVK